MLQPWFADHSTSVFPVPAIGGPQGPVASARKPGSDAKLAERNSAPKVTVAGSNPPSEVLQRPELFVDYAVIRDLDILESGRGNGGSHAG